MGCHTNSLKSLQLIQNAAARVLKRTNKRDCISPVLASLHWPPVKFRIEFKILTYKALNDQVPSYLKDLIVRYFPNKALLKLQVYLWFPEFLKVEWESEPSVIRPLSCGTSQNMSGKQTPSLTLRLALKTFLFDKAYWQGWLR